MKINNKRVIRNFTASYPDADDQVNAWESDVEEAQWQTPHELKQRYPKASIIGGKQVVFNICGNKYRIWVTVGYKNGVVFIVKAGTHKEYDNWKIK